MPRSERNKPEGAEDAPQRLVDLFGSFGPAYARVLGRRGRAGGTRTPWQQLRLLELLRCRGQQPMSQVGAGLGVTARNVTSLVDRLEVGRLVRRVPHPSDRRVTLLELTDRGRTLNRRLFATHRARAAKLFDRLSAKDQAELERIMRQLNDELAGGMGED